jgi:hypothetical protein
VVVLSGDVCQRAGAQVVELGQQRTIERHQQRPITVVGRRIAEQSGPVDGHRRLARASSA